MKKLRETFGKIVKSEFTKNVLTLTSGTALAQIIPLLLAPILSRIYTPEDFGRLALYFAIVQILSSISSGRYELAIMLPKEREKGVQLTLLAITITLLFSLLVLIIVLSFPEEIANLLGDEKLKYWLYLVPLSIFMMGSFNALNYYNTREKKFKVIATANIFKALGGSFSQFMLGVLKYTAGGLILGQVFSHLFGNLKMVKTFFKDINLIKGVTRGNLKSLAIRYIDFPKFSLWAIFMNTASTNFINFFIARFYSLGSLGHFSYANRYLGFPITLIGNSIGQVYFQKIAKNKDDKAISIRIFYNAIKRLAIIGLILFLPLYFVIEELYAFIFGEEWRIAGQYAKILVPLVFMRFIVIPLTITNSVFEKQKISFFWQLGLMLLTIGILLYSKNFNLSIPELLWMQTICLFSYYLFLLFIIQRVILRKI